MKFVTIPVSILAGALSLFATAVLAQRGIPMDTPTTIGGIETVCTGVGEQAQDPRWLAYCSTFRWLIVTGSFAVAGALTVLSRDNFREMQFEEGL